MQKEKKAGADNADSRKGIIDMTDHFDDEKEDIIDGDITETGSNDHEDGFDQAMKISSAGYPSMGVTEVEMLFDLCL